MTDHKIPVDPAPDGPNPAATSTGIETLLEEHRSFAPPEGFRKNANYADPGIWAKADADWEGWWESWAEQLQWDQPWEQVLEWEPPYAKWFLGGKLNASVQCLDRHVVAPAAAAAAQHGGSDARRHSVRAARVGRDDGTGNVRLAGVLFHVVDAVLGGAQRRRLLGSAIP